MSERYPGYDVLAKRDTPSWNEQTRRVIDQRLAMPREPRFCTAAEWPTLEAICARIVSQPATRPPVPLAAMVDAKLFADRGDGYRDARLPPLRASHSMQSTPPSRMRCCGPRRTGASPMQAGAACRARCFSSSTSCLTS